ncbi:MAG: HAMP domain-containing sensor histidine kinase [Pseudomonadota bacterium]
MAKETVQSAPGKAAGSRSALGLDRFLLAFEPELEEEFWSSLYYQRRNILTLALLTLIILIPFSSALFVPFASEKMSLRHQVMDALVPAITGGIPLGLACWRMWNTQVWQRVSPLIATASMLSGVSYSLLFLAQDAELAPFCAYSVAHILLLSHMFLVISFRTLVPLTVVIAGVFLVVAYIQQPEASLLTGTRFAATSVAVLGLILLYASFTIESIARQNFIYERSLKEDDEKRLRIMRGRLVWLDTMTTFVKDELGNALTAVRSILQRMRRAGIPAAQETYQSRCEESARLIQRLLTEVGKAKTMESALAHMDMIEIDVAQMLGRKLSDYRTQYPATKFELALASSDRLIGDEDRLTQALDKLVNNAIEHSDHEEPVQIEARTQGGLVTVSVRNSGPCMTDSEKIFDAHVSSHKNTGNMGLGLFVARRIVEAHSGHLNARNLENGKGVEFSMTFKVAEH